MRSMLPIMLLLFGLSSASSASSDPETWIPRCGGPFQLCGYTESGNEILRIPQTFEVAKQFSEGLAAVRIDGRYGFIDPTGTIAIAPRFEAAGPFTGGYAEVRLDGASGAIDRSGKLVVAAQFERLIPFAGGTFLATPRREGSPSPYQEEAHIGGFSQLDLLFAGGGLYNLQKGWLTEANFQFDFFDKASRGLVWAGQRDSHNDEIWGLMRSDGTWQVTPRYNHVQVMWQNHAVVTSMPDYSIPWPERSKAILKGAVDRDGKLIVPLEQRGISYWRGGYGLASEPGTGRDGILLEDGALLAGRWFDDVEIREDGKLPRGRIGDTWYSIKRDGRLVADQLEGEPLVECSSGLTILRRGDMVEFKAAGATKPGPQFDNTYFNQRDCPGPFSVRRHGKWFFVLEDGKVLGEPNGFNSTYFFHGDYGVVQVGGKWGIIDRSGAFTVKPSFARLNQRGWNVFLAGNGKSTSWINAKGARVAKPTPVKPDPKKALTCEGGLRFVANDGLWGLEDGDGKIVIEPRYRALSCFHQGVSWTAAVGVDEWCPIGPEGMRREAMKCRRTFYPVMLTHHYPEKFSDDAYESSVLWTRAWLDTLAGTRDHPPKWISDGERGEASYSVMPGQPSE
jgi:hypothetical protein